MSQIRRVKISDIIADKKRLTAREQIKLDKTTKKILEGKQQKDKIVVSENNILQSGYVLYLAYLNICHDLTLEVELQKTEKNS